MLYVQNHFIEREEIAGVPHEFSEEKTVSLISSIVAESQAKPEPKIDENAPIRPRRISFY